MMFLNNETFELKKKSCNGAVYRVTASDCP